MLFCCSDLKIKKKKMLLHWVAAAKTGSVLNLFGKIQLTVLTFGFLRVKVCLKSLPCNHLVRKSVFDDEILFVDSFIDVSRVRVGFESSKQQTRNTKHTKIENALGSAAACATRRAVCAVRST